MIVCLAVLLLLSRECLAEPTVIISKNDCNLYLVDDDKILKMYKISIGLDESPTPEGEFKVQLKEENPTWYPTGRYKDKGPVPPGSDNPLGTRWIQFSYTYGIHGTIYPEYIGQPASGGCIRMHNKDVEELFEKVKVGTPVIIMEHYIKPPKKV